MKKIRVGITGGAGYTGGELIRILLNHPQVSLDFVQSRSNAGKPLHAMHQDLTGETEILFTESIHSDIDLIFLCVGHGEARKWLQENVLPESVRLIDLSQDFRLAANNRK